MMPRIEGGHIGVAFDMQGCPNRCRHCWLGPAGSVFLSCGDVRWAVSAFREYLGASIKLSVATWFREPDYSDDYRRLYDLEAELGDGKPARYELLSVWRIARDRTYVDWARSVGPDTCQISFFGMRETNDWFHRRRGAFDDALTATERLLAGGMKPRWQVFLTTKLLPELGDLLGLVEQHRLFDRVRELGGEFQMFLHLPGPDHEARRIEELRPTADLLTNLPETILESTRRYLGRKILWKTEETLHAEILAGGEESIIMPEVLWFFVCGNWDVFANLGTLEEWWCLGNLRRDGIDSIFRRFERDDTVGLKTLLHRSPRELAEQHGNPRGRRVYSGRDDLLSLYRGESCEREWKC